MRIPQVLAISAFAAFLLSGCSPMGVANVFTARADSAADAVAQSSLKNAYLAAMTYLVENQSVQTLTVDDLTLNAIDADVALHFSSADSFCFDTTSKSGTVFKATDEGSTEGACVEGVDF